MRPPLTAILAAAALISLPFINKAYHVDDTVFLRIARQILEHPSRPYDFSYNWSLTPLPVWLFNLHPPLNPYLLAAVGVAAKEREVPTHAAYLLLTLSCTALMFALARRFCRNPALPTILTLTSPVFFVSATGVMADIPLLFFCLLSVWLTVLAAENDRPHLLWAAGTALSCAAMTKYFGLAFAPLLAVYWTLKARRATPHASAFMLPVLSVLLWGCYSVPRCGFFHPLGSAGFGTGARHDFIRDFGTSLAFLGGGLLWPTFCLPLLLRLRARAWLAGASAGLLALAGMGVPDPRLWAVLVLGGAASVAFAAAGASARRDADAALLALWLGGTLVFVMFLNWTVNARVLLPLAFPAAVLAVRWVESSPNPRPGLVLMSLACATTLAVSFDLALADQDLADAGRSFARSTARTALARGARARFIGHWGFQYYMEKEGAEPFDYKDQRMADGDIVFVSLNNSTTLPTQAVVRTAAAYPVASRRWLTTMDVPGGRAGFYSSLFGPAPFALSRGAPTDTFLVQEYGR